ncbi:hypothetical protein NR996_01735 [Lactobacillus rodentium]|uniref:Uncharacterized protein n=1 Tax=Lactobacillus rodentium TaxID=947835 RepID=A0A2Z6TRT0_9LACO|nr:hypothetical protein [Lactobacillus rodentium]MCR1894133.1 hypothetical protein [Lactobacillus rodentium]GBG04429.1 hypothetical protein LrDSM24759_03430 [Lactobacillus rodentium]
MYSSKNEIEKIIQKILNKRSTWKLSPRRKNTLTLSLLGIDEEEIFELIEKNLKWTDYFEGPEPDNHVPPIPGDIWKFGLIIENNELYIKFQDRPQPLDDILWISIHSAEYPINYPYK